MIFIGRGRRPSFAHFLSFLKAEGQSSFSDPEGILNKVHSVAFLEPSIISDDII